MLGGVLTLLFVILQRLAEEAVVVVGVYDDDLLIGIQLLQFVQALDQVLGGDPYATAGHKGCVSLAVYVALVDVDLPFGGTLDGIVAVEAV